MKKRRKSFFPGHGNSPSKGPEVEGSMAFGRTKRRSSGSRAQRQKSAAVRHTGPVLRVVSSSEE